jgi:hypothetical protein
MCYEKRRIWKKHSTVTTYTVGTIRDRPVNDTKDKYTLTIYRLKKICESAKIVNDYEAMDLKWGALDFPEREVSALPRNTETSTKTSYKA